MNKIKFPNGKTFFILDKLTAKDVYTEIYEDNVYLKYGIQIKSGDIVIDAGAHIGVFSSFISEKISNLNVYAIEPIPQIFEVLQANLRNNPDVKKIYNVGLSDKDGSEQFYFYPKVSADSTSIPFVFDKQVEMLVRKYRKGIAQIIPKKAFTNLITKVLQKAYAPVKINCQMKTLSQIIEDNNLEQINLLKLDTENAEQKVINGIKEKDWEKIQQIAMEVHTNIPNGENLIPYLTSLMKEKGFVYTLDTESRFSFLGVHMLYATRTRESGIC